MAEVTMFRKNKYLRGITAVGMAVIFLILPSLFFMQGIDPFHPVPGKEAAGTTTAAIRACLAAWDRSERDCQKPDHILEKILLDSPDLTDEAGKPLRAAGADEDPSARGKQDRHRQFIRAVQTLRAPPAASSQTL